MNQHVATGRKSHTVYRINEIRQLLAVCNVCSLQSLIWFWFIHRTSGVNHSGQVEIKTSELAFSEQLNYSKYSIKLQLRQDVENQIQLQLHHFCIINYNFNYNYVIGPSSGWNRWSIAHCPAFLQQYLAQTGITSIMCCAITQLTSTALRLLRDCLSDHFHCCSMWARAGQEYFVLKYICTQVQFVKYLECTQVHFWEIFSTCTCT